MKGFMQNGQFPNFYTANPQLNLSFQSQTQQGLRDQQGFQLQENTNLEENDQNFVQNQVQYENNNYDDMKQEQYNEDFQQMVQNDKQYLAKSNGNSSLQNHVNSSNKEQEQDTQKRQAKLGKVRAVPHSINQESPLPEQEASSTQGKSSKTGEDQVSSNNSIKNEGQSQFNSDSDYIQKKIINNNYIHQVIIVQRQNTEEIQGYDKQFKDMINFQGDTHIQANNQQEQIFTSQQIQNGVQIQGLENINNTKQQYCKSNSDFSGGNSSSSSNYNINNHHQKKVNIAQNATRYNLRKKNQINYTESNNFQDDEDNKNNDQIVGSSQQQLQQQQQMINSNNNQQFQKFGVPQHNNNINQQQQQKQQIQEQQIQQLQQQQNIEKQNRKEQQKQIYKYPKKQNCAQVPNQPKKREYSKIDYQNDQTFRELQNYRNGAGKAQSNGAMSMDEKNSLMRSSDRESKHNISIESNVEMDEEFNSRNNSLKKIQYENENEQDGYQEECEEDGEEEDDYEEEQKKDINSQNFRKQQNDDQQYKEDEIQTSKNNNNNQNDQNNQQLVLANGQQQQQKKNNNNINYQLTEKQIILMHQIYNNKKIPKYLLDNKFHIINYSNKWIDKFLHIEAIQFLLYVSKHSQMVNIFEKNNRDILLAKPSLPTREQFMQRAHQMKQNQKTSKYHNKTKLFINCLVRFFTRQNLNNLRLPTQLQETIFQFIDKIRITGVSLKQNNKKSVNKSDLFNNSHLRLMFLNLVDFDIDELKGKSYNNDIFLHKTVFGLDLNPELVDKNDEQQLELIYYATFLKKCVYEILNLHLRQDLCVSKPEHISYNNNKLSLINLPQENNSNNNNHHHHHNSQNNSNVSSPQMTSLKKKDSFTTNSSIFKEDESLKQKKQNEAKNNINPQQSTLSQSQLELIPDNNDTNGGGSGRNGQFRKTNLEENNYCEERDYENKTFKIIDQLMQGKMVKRIQ